MLPDNLAIVPATAIGTSDRLEPFVNRLFGGDRVPGWWSRKVHRECVRDELSAVLVETEVGQTAKEAASDPTRWRGYVLLGTPPSMAPIAKTATLGLAEDVRGLGLGKALVDHVRRAAAAEGVEEIVSDVEADQLGWYEQVGFKKRAEKVHLLSFATGDEAGTNTQRPGPWPNEDGRLIAGWNSDAWTRTPARGVVQRRLTPHASLQMGFSREGRAILVHWIIESGEVPPPKAYNAIKLTELFAAPAPLVIYGCDPNDARIRSLVETGMAEGQRYTQMVIATA